MIDFMCRGEDSNLRPAHYEWPCRLSTHIFQWVTNRYANLHAPTLGSGALCRYEVRHTGGSR